MSVERPGVRLAELVAALSLGIDLGFGRPMEHVLRRTLIALRLAERAGLDEDDRAAVYYTALLINVGCHSDAHEQAKWFGDDIVLKSGTKFGAPMMARQITEASGRDELHATLGELYSRESPLEYFVALGRKEAR